MNDRVDTYRLAVRRFVSARFGPDGGGVIPAHAMADFLDSLEPVAEATVATFQVTREAFDKFCEAADVEGYIGRIELCAGLTAMGIKNEYVEYGDTLEHPENCKGGCCLG